MDPTKLSNDAFYLLLFLFPGYIGFRVYFIDKPWNALNPVHIFFGSLVFSMFTYFLCGSLISVLHLSEPFKNVLQTFGLEEKFYAQFMISISSAPIAVIIGLMWRRFGHPWFHRTLATMGFTNEDNDATPWMQIFNNTRIRLSQITVYLKDGTALQCDETQKYDQNELRKWGIYAYYASHDGDIYFIANKVISKEIGSPPSSAFPDTPLDIRNADEPKDIPGIISPIPWGVNIQWIPAREIARVEARACPIPRKKINYLELPRLTLGWLGRYYLPWRLKLVLLWKRWRKSQLSTRSRR